MSVETNAERTNSNPQENQAGNSDAEPNSILKNINGLLSKSVLPDGVIRACSQIAADWASYIVPIISALYIINNIPDAYKSIAFWAGWTFIFLCSLLGLFSSFLIARENTQGLNTSSKWWVRVIAIIFSAGIIACLIGQIIIEHAKAHS